ncbi:hypothetical protein GB937_003066 [Aspergillus fischeri]|nr:hypothetical protein GB937_003066 [Aspergillus fischeri]
MASTQGNVGRKVEWIEKLESMPHLNYIFLEGIVNVPYGFIIRGTNSRLYLPSEHCKTAGLRTPMYTLFSDRRGGRTAWSSSVEVQGRSFFARYWYDGNFTINAKHDAAEVALTFLTSQQQPQARSETLPGKVWP